MVKTTMEKKEEALAALQRAWLQKLGDPSYDGVAYGAEISAMSAGATPADIAEEIASARIIFRAAARRVVPRYD